MPEPAESALQGAFAALDVAGVPYTFRKGSGRAVEPPPGGEVDIALERRNVAAADSALAGAGFHVLTAPGHGTHRFYLGCWRGRWLKIDARLEDATPLPGAARRVAGRRPASWRRLGPVVAVLGPDGAGKGTVISHLADEIPLEVKVLYLGWRKRSAAVPRPAPKRPPPGPLLESAFVLKGWLRARLTLLGGYAAAWRGAIVLCDRHPVEGLAVRPRHTRAAAALERTLLSRLTPWPDAVVVLDAPAETLLARKREHPREVLDRWRQDYADVFDGRGGTVVSSDRPREETVAQASTVVWDALGRRRRWR
jgi:thymidylate kinase